MLERIKGYKMTCDICGCEFEIDGSVSIFETAAEAFFTCLECGWDEIERGKFACDECVEKHHNTKEYEND